MNFFVILLAGLVGTTLMVFYLEFVTRMGWANGNLIRAISSMFGHAQTSEHKNILGPGVILHYTLGIVFAWFYTALASLLPVQATAPILVMAGFMGLMHGMVVGLMLTIFIAEHHPMEKFRDVGVQMAAVHVGAHIFYGLGVGGVLALTRPFQFTAWEFPQGVFTLGIFGLVFSGMVVFALLFFGMPLIFAGEEMLHGNHFRRKRKKLASQAA